MNKVICIVGPTAIGKTKLSLELANIINSEIINGDAIQIYKGLDILSAKPSINELKEVKHYLIDYLDINNNIDIAYFKNEASNIIDKLHLNNKIPIIVGGSGLYLKALLYDYNLNDINGRNIDINNKYQDYSNEELLNYLKDIDYEASLKLHYNNRKRVLRAIEIYENNDISKTNFINKQEHKMIYDVLIIGLEIDRDILYELINTRVDKMIELGLVNEVKDLYNKYQDSNKQVFQAIGFKEIVGYLNNEYDLNNAIELIKQHSRRYAKKQITWFKNQMDVKWIESYPNDFDKTIDNALLLVNDFIKDGD